MAELPDILYLVHRVPYPPDKGDRIRNFHVLRFLSSRARVHLACLADEPVPAATLQSLGEYCHRIAVHPVHPRLRWFHAGLSLARGRTISEGAFHSSQFTRTLTDWTRETRFHCVLASASSMASYLRLPALRDLPTVVDLVDVDSQKWLDYAANCGRVKARLYRLEARRLRALETSLSEHSRAVTLVSEAESTICRGFCRPNSVHTVPNGVDLEYFSPAPRQDVERSSVQCLFVGALDYRPNIDGVRWFCTEVWPKVIAAIPTAKIQLVGRRPTPDLHKLATQPGVELVGQVPDVRPYLADASLVVVPLRLARGVQNKVLEAMAMAKPVVASPQSVQGIRGVAGRDFLVASTADDWVNSIHRLFGDPLMRSQLGTAGYEFVQRNHHWDMCLKPFEELVGLAGDERKKTTRNMIEFMETVP